ncbi:FadR/GntR family transcriptional regulator [Egicoccus sp. AB-alg6-2]|uniref:FadR/GntR family transcriptional regulator n=1 Tax=Egicoccus sp. AB-alg6-2 TaxID=3242692 RepID=UPI00359D844E
MFRPVRTNRVSAEIVQQIEAAIESGHLEVGDRLPTERDLTERFGVSRVTVRDALRILEATGLVEVRMGARGGAFVTAPQPDRLGQNLGRMLQLSAVEPWELEETRSRIELTILDLAVERATEEDFAALREICDRTEEAIAAGAYHPRLSAEFHVRLAGSAHNLAMTLLFDSLHGAILLNLLRARATDPKHGPRGLSEHRALIEAIERRDRAGARAVLAEHLERTAHRIRSRPRQDLRQAVG